MKERMGGVRMSIPVLLLLVACDLSAHEAEGGSTSGLFGLKPEYVHVLLNPLPVYGLLIGVLVLTVGLIARSTAARKTGLIITVLCGAAAWPVLYFGQHAYNQLHATLDPASQQWLEVHMARAERYVYAFYATALLGIGALVPRKTFLKTRNVLAVLTLISALVALGLGGWISRAGGQIRHSEFRGGEAPSDDSSHHYESKRHE